MWWVNCVVELVLYRGHLYNRDTGPNGVQWIIQVATVVFISNILGESIGGSIRLEGGNDTAGWLQVQLEDSDTWGTVCGLDFIHYDGHVACREMGFQTTSGFSMRQ